MTPEDFQVEELWESDSLGQGEHFLFKVRKRDANTHWVARNLARFAGVRDMDVAYMGLKDRHAVTTQYLSVYLGPRPAPDWSQFSLEGVQVEYLGRIPKKLRRGQHAGNRFRITLSLEQPVDEALVAQLQSLRETGFPNAFGLQRFGHEMGNLEKGQAWLAGGGRRPRNRQQQGLYLSAIRSAFFNAALRKRIQNGTWNTLLPQDRPMALAMPMGLPAGRRVCQVASSWMPGGKEWEDKCLADFELESYRGREALLAGLHQQGVRAQSRPLVASCQDLSWESAGLSRFTLTFSLGVGCYASSLLNCLFDLKGGVDETTGLE